MERPPITHVAIRFQGKIWSLPRPYRHHHVIQVIIYLDSFRNTEITHVDAHGEDQGFLDAEGRYLNRKQAIVNAELNGQFKEGHPTCPRELYSEDVW